MTSTLVSYSSGEEEPDNEQGKRHSDANYDNADMDMSAEDEDNETLGSQMFASKEDFKAYQSQFNDRKRDSSREESQSNQSASSLGESTVKRTEEQESKKAADTTDRRHRHHRHRSRSRSRDQ